MALPDLCAVSFPLAPALQLSVDVDARSARVALIDKCKADSAAPEPIGVIRKDDVALDLGCVRVCLELGLTPLASQVALFFAGSRSISFTGAQGIPKCKIGFERGGEGWESWGKGDWPLCLPHPWCLC